MSLKLHSQNAICFCPFCLLKYCSFRYFREGKKSTAIWTKNLAWKFYPFRTHNTVRGSLYAVLKMKFHTRMTSGQRERPAFGPLFLREFYSPPPPLPRGEVHPPEGEKKNWRTQKSTFAWTGGKSTADCADRFSRRVPNRSISQFAEWWASGAAIPENCAFTRFRSPRLFMEAMQFTDNGPYTLVAKKDKRVYAHVRTSPRDDATLIEFLDPRHSAWLFVTCAIYLRVILVSRWQCRRAKKKKDEERLSVDVLFNERHRILQIWTSLRP